MPVETLRAEKANEDGEIPEYYYYKDWSQIKPNEKPLRIPAYGMSKEGIEIPNYCQKCKKNPNNTM